MIPFNGTGGGLPGDSGTLNGFSVTVWVFRSTASIVLSGSGTTAIVGDNYYLSIAL